jgi:hypothetical protein
VSCREGSGLAGPAGIECVGPDSRHFGWGWIAFIQSEWELCFFLSFYFLLLSLASLSETSRVSLDDCYVHVHVRSFLCVLCNLKKQ